jgi:hypothetical protein
MLLLAAATMDEIDWAVFIVAAVATPLAMWANVRWWLKSRQGELPRDWQSFWLVFLGLLCMVVIVCWYLVKYIWHGLY